MNLCQSGDFTMFDDCGMLVSEPCLGLVLDDGDIEEIVIDDRGDVI